ncbi:histidine kinase dimerization/phospho-acceptor domain-containing protein [Achromobacter xylosoxidans]
MRSRARRSTGPWLPSPAMANRRPWRWRRWGWHCQAGPGPIWPHGRASCRCAGPLTARSRASWCWASVRGGRWIAPTATSSTWSPSIRPAPSPAPSPMSRRLGAPKPWRSWIAPRPFFSNVSHEFRTPLTLILGPLQQALAQPSAGLERETLELLLRNALRLQKLVNSLLDFSRIEGAAWWRGCSPPTWPAPPRSTPARSDRRWRARGWPCRYSATRCPRAHRSRLVRKNRAEPVVQRVQVHLAGIDRRGLARQRR